MLTRSLALATHLRITGGGPRLFLEEFWLGPMFDLGLGGCCFRKTGCICFPAWDSTGVTTLGKHRGKGRNFRIELRKTGA